MCKVGLGVSMKSKKKRVDRVYKEKGNHLLSLEGRSWYIRYIAKKKVYETEKEIKKTIPEKVNQIGFAPLIQIDCR